ncbi:hypothetical protein CCP3SC1AL1_750015 [Gammaproteobacteria bacterium]
MSTTQRGGKGKPYVYHSRYVQTRDNHDNVRLSKTFFRSYIKVSHRGIRNGSFSR